MEHKISTPTKKINSVLFEKDYGYQLFERDNQFYISGNCTLEEALNALDKHNPTDKTAEKAALLAKLGISADEAKLLLS